MLVYLPFLWFLVLLIIIVRKRGFDISAYITIIYLISSFFTISYINGGVSADRSNISLFPSFAYCILSTLIILPVSKIKLSKFFEFGPMNVKMLNFLTYYFFISLVYMVVRNFDTILFNLTFSDLADLRQQIMSGDSGPRTSSFIDSLLFWTLGFPGTISYVMFPVFFISLIYLKKPMWFNLLAFIGTMNVIANGIIQIDRSSTFHWLLILGFNYFLFKNQLSNTVKRKIRPIIAIFSILSILYLSSVTLGRFQDKETSKNSFVFYAGQSYVNFCYFWDHFDSKGETSTKFLFPATHYFIIKDYKGNVEYQRELSEKTGVECGVFYSVLGNFLIDWGKAGPFLFILLYLLVFSLINRKKINRLSMSRFYSYYFFAQISIFGIISYNFVAPNQNLAIVAFFIMLQFVPKNGIISRIK